MTKTATKLAQKIARTEELLKQQKAQLKAQELKKNATQKLQERKEKMRKKLVLGAFLLKEMEADPALKEQLKEKLSQYVKRPNQRKLLGLD